MPVVNPPTQTGNSRACSPRRAQANARRPPRRRRPAPRPGRADPPGRRPVRSMTAGVARVVRDDRDRCREVAGGREQEADQREDQGRGGDRRRPDQVRRGSAGRRRGAGTSSAGSAHAATTPTATIARPERGEPHLRCPGPPGRTPSPIVAWATSIATAAAPIPSARARNPPIAIVVRPEAEDAAARPEPGEQADRRRHRGEERGRRTGAAGDRQERPDEVRQQPGQRAGPRSRQRADEHGPDRVEVERQPQQGRQRPDRDVDRDRDGHEAQRRRREVARPPHERSRAGRRRPRAPAGTPPGSGPRTGRRAVRADRQPVHRVSPPHRRAWRPGRRRVRSGGPGTRPRPP